MITLSVYFLFSAVLGFFYFPTESEKKTITPHAFKKVIEELEDEVVLRDTSGWLVFDSVKNNLDTFSIDTFGYRLIKHFKYIGPKPGVIVRAFTSDPHFICKYPKEPLQPDTLYTLTICFSWHGRTGYPMTKSMGLVFWDGSRSTFVIKGLPLKPKD